MRTCGRAAAASAAVPASTRAGPPDTAAAAGTRTARHRAGRGAASARRSWVHHLTTDARRSTVGGHVTGLLAGKGVLITGAGSGISEATAELLASEGADVFGVEINGEAASRVATTIGAAVTPF